MNTPNPKHPQPPTSLVREVARRTGLTREQAYNAVSEALAIIRDSESVMIRNFGTFYRSHRKGHRRPMPGAVDQLVDVPAYNRLALRTKPERD